MFSGKILSDPAGTPNGTLEPARWRKVLLASFVAFFLLSATPIAPTSVAADGRVTAKVRIVSVELQREASRRVLRLQNGIALTDDPDDVERSLVRVRRDPVSSLIVVEYTAN